MNMKNVHNVFTTTGRLVVKEREKHKIMEELVRSLISKFLPQIQELPEDERVTVVSAALKTWMIFESKEVISYQFIEKDVLLLRLLGFTTTAPSRNKIKKELDKLTCLKNRVAENAHGVVRVTGLYELVEDEDG